MTTKTKLIFKILKTILKHPKSLQGILDEEVERKDYVIKKYGRKYGLPTIDLLDLFPKFEETVMPYSYLEGTSLPTDLALLKMLCRRFSRCRYLEIGTWRGESVANVASVAEECISVDLSEKEMKKRGFSNAFLANLRFFSENSANIKYLGRNSLTLNFSVSEKFDLIFIDGDHRYEAVKADTQNAFKLLRDSSSVIVWHDYGFSSEHIRWSVLAGILDGCPEEKRSHLYHVSNTVCAFYTNREFKTEKTVFPQVPDKVFTVKLSATRIKKAKSNKKSKNNNGEVC